MFFIYTTSKEIEQYHTTPHNHDSRRAMQWPESCPVTCRQRGRLLLLLTCQKVSESDGVANPGTLVLRVHSAH